MSTRLVVGCGSVGRQLAGRLAGRPGNVFVVSDSAQRVSAVRDRGIDAATVSFEDASSIQGVVDDVSSVIIGGELPARNLALARLAAEAYPEQFCLAYAGHDASADDRAALGTLVDRVVDTGSAVYESLEPSIGPAGRPTRRLQRRLRSLEGPLAIVTHDNPDPDAIGSAIALCRLAEIAGLEAEACYYGRISHQENLAFVNLLGYELRKLRPDTDLSAFGSIALVDHARPGVNDGLPPETQVDMVLDHHPPREPVDAPYADLRTDAGATSTLLTDHLRRLEPDPRRRWRRGYCSAFASILTISPAGSPGAIWTRRATSIRSRIPTSSRPSNTRRSRHRRSIPSARRSMALSSEGRRWRRSSVRVSSGTRSPRLPTGC